MNIILKNPLVVFDIEATGLDISNDRIIEICFVKIGVDTSQQVWTVRVNPEMHIPAQTSKIHGIYDEDVADKKTFKQIAKDVSDFLKGCDLGGYNILKFDIPLLIEEFERVNIKFDITKKKIIDAQKIFHMMEKRNLSAAYKFYCKKDLKNAHSAEADTLATWEIIDKQAALYENQEVTDLKGKVKGVLTKEVASFHDIVNKDIVDFAGRFAYNDKREIIFNFGKHKGKLVSQVLLNDSGYYEWMLRGNFTRNTKQILTDIKLKNSSFNR